MALILRCQSCTCTSLRVNAFLNMGDWTPHLSSPDHAEKSFSKWSGLEESSQASLQYWPQSETCLLKIQPVLSPVVKLPTTTQWPHKAIMCAFVYYNTTISQINENSTPFLHFK